MPASRKGNQDDEIISRLKSIQDSVRDEGGHDTPRIPLIDPTANVLSLVTAAIARQDDLRIAERRRQDDIRRIEERCSLEVGELKEKLADAESRRIDATNTAEARRLDAVLAEQKSAVVLDREKTAAQAATLATQVISVAEAMRTQVATTTVSTTNAIDTLRLTLEKRLTTVEQNQYQGIGVNTQRGESRQQIQWSIGTIIGALGFLAALLMVILRLSGK